MIIFGVLSMVASAVAVILAMLANAHARKEGNAARRMIAAERQRTFDLEVLRDLAKSFGKTRGPGPGGEVSESQYHKAKTHVRSLLLMIDPKELPQVRGWADGQISHGVSFHRPHSPFPGTVYFEGGVYATLLAEIQEAIARRLHAPAE